MLNLPFRILFTGRDKIIIKKVEKISLRKGLENAETHMQQL